MADPLPPELLELIEQLNQIAGRLKGAILTAGAPDNLVGAEGSVAIDPYARVWYGPKTAEGWGEGVALSGADGRPVEMRRSGDQIQWRLEGDEAWTDLVALDDLIPAFEIGTVTTGAPGSPAEATITGGAGAPVLNLTLPRGDVGPQGEIGPDTVAALMALGPVVARGDLYGLDTLPAALGFALAATEGDFSGGYYRAGPVHGGAVDAWAGWDFARSSKAYGLIDGVWTAFAADAPVITPAGMQAYPAYANLLPQGERPDDGRYWAHANGAAFDGAGRWNGVGHIFSGAAAPAGRITGSITLDDDAEAPSVAVWLYQNGEAPIGYVRFVPQTGDPTEIYGPVTVAAPKERDGEGWRVHVSAVLTEATPEALLLLSAANGPLTPRRAQINLGWAKPYQPSAPAATNLVRQSENFTVSPWAATIAGTSTRANAAGPHGFTLAQVVATSTNGGLRQSVFGLVSGVRHVLTFYAESVASFALELEDGLAAYGRDCAATLDPTTGGAIIVTGFTSITSAPLGDGWIYRVVLPLAGGLGLANLEWRLADGQTLLLGRPQLEEGAVSTAYIPTEASQVTRVALDPVRAADVAAADDIEIGPHGTVVVELDAAPQPGAVGVLAATDEGRLLYLTEDGSAASGDLIGPGVTPGQPVRLGLTWSPGRCAVTATGGAVAASAAPPVAASGLMLGHQAGADQAGAVIRRIAVLDHAVSDAALQAMTEMPA